MMRFIVLFILWLPLSGCDLSRVLIKDPGLTPAAFEQAQAEGQSHFFAEPKIVMATGYAPISLQPGKTKGQKVLMAMRASKLRAYQELAAIVHGQYLFGTTQISDMVIGNDRFNAAVGGVVRGARVVKSYPIQEDTYATILELDLREVQRAYIDMQP